MKRGVGTVCPGPMPDGQSRKRKTKTSRNQPTNYTIQRWHDVIVKSMVCMYLRCGPANRLDTVRREWIRYTVIDRLERIVLEGDVQSGWRAEKASCRVGGSSRFYIARGGRPLPAGRVGGRRSRRRQCGRKVDPRISPCPAAVVAVTAVTVRSATTDLAVFEIDDWKYFRVSPPYVSWMF